jgi:quinol monooxygenase YgiN
MKKVLGLMFGAMLLVGPSAAHAKEPRVSLLVTLHSKPGKQAAVAEFLSGALPLANQEPYTIVWFALKNDPSTFAIWDAFPDETGRQAHLSGPIAAALMAKASELFDKPPQIDKVDVLAAKLAGRPKAKVSVSLYVPLTAKPGKEAEVAAFLSGALPLANREPATIVWFALKTGPSTFAIFDAFPDEAGRQAHASGPIAAALTAKANELFAKPPRIDKVDILAAKLNQ